MYEAAADVGEIRELGETREPGHREMRQGWGGVAARDDDDLQESGNEFYQRHSCAAHGKPLAVICNLECMIFALHYRTTGIVF